MMQAHHLQTACICTNEKPNTKSREKNLNETSKEDLRQTVQEKQSTKAWTAG